MRRLYSVVKMDFPFDIHIFSQTLFFFAIVICGFITSIPIGVTSMQFSGGCLLNSEQAKWYNETYLIFKPGDNGLCNFVVYLNVFVCILYALGMGIYYTYALCKKDLDIGRQMWVMPFILVNSLITVLIFIGCCIVSAGLSEFCTALTSGKSPIIKQGCASSQNATLVKWFNRDDPAKKYYGGTWYTYYSVASSAFWFLFLFWVIETALSIFRWYRNRRARSADMFTDPTTADTAPVTDSPLSHPM